MRQPARSTAAICALAGGTLWALTPLRQPLFQAGRSPAEGETFFRFYNALIVVVAVLLTVALVRLLLEEYRPKGRAFLVGWWMILAGHALIFSGSLTGVVLGGWMTDFVMAAQDVGFLGALVAALGAAPLGIVGLRHGGLPTPASAMFAAALPIGLLGITLLTGLGVPEDFLGLPFTVLYGGAWVVMGGYWTLALQGTEPVPPQG
jgi:hypothetical protein